MRIASSSSSGSTPFPRKPLAPALDCLDDEVVVFEGGEDDDADTGQVVVFGDPAGGGDAVQNGHADVHEDDVSSMGVRERHGLGSRGRFSDDRHLG